jgi:hypothetical protein
MPNNYILLETISLAQNTASVTFDNLPTSGYTDLKIVVSARTDRGGNPDQATIRFNGSTTDYTQRTLEGYNNGTSSYSNTYAFAYVNASGSTASTFSNAEFYIPNYTGSTNKSFSIESAVENNSAAGGEFPAAGLWSNTAAITSITLISQVGANFVANSTFSLYGIAALGTNPVFGPKAIGGNIVEYDGTYWIHTFLASGVFTPQTGLTCDYLVIAGGGGGAGNYGGGGGAGGYKAGSGLSVASFANYPVIVGAGGIGVPASRAPGSNGSNSIFSSITSDGGGVGGSGNPQIAAEGPKNGGSGGANGGYVPSTAGVTTSVGTGISGQGNNGGASSGFGWKAGGGGGGASAAGANGSNNGSIALGGNGGAGTASSITGTSVTRAGGGGSGAGYIGTEGTAGTGGAGGGGNGSNTTNGSPGTANTGGGGGGGDQISNGGAGGSGIVIIRYPAA